MLSGRCPSCLYVCLSICPVLSCLSVCDDGVLWPNGWIDQDETWHSSARPHKKGAQPPIFGPCPLWPKGWMDQDPTWYRGRPRPRRYCVRWGPRCPHKKRGTAAPQSRPMYYGQTAGWVKMPLGVEVGLGPGDIVLDGDPASPSKKGGTALPNFRPMSIVAKRLDGSTCHLVRR